MERAAGAAFLRWATQSPQPLRRFSWSVLTLTAATCAGLLIWRLNMPGDLWQQMVSPHPPSITPWGKRIFSFSPPFLVLNWTFFLPPLFAFGEQMKERAPLSKRSLRRFQLTLAYAVFQFVSVGLLLGRIGSWTEPRPPGAGRMPAASTGRRAQPDQPAASPATPERARGISGRESLT